MKSLTESVIEHICQGSDAWTPPEMTPCQQEISHPLRDWLAFVMTLASMSVFTIVTIVMVIQTVASY